MRLKDDLIASRYSVMQLRARGLPAIRQSKYLHDIAALEKSNAALMDQLVLVASQRDLYARQIQDMLERLK